MEVDFLSLNPLAVPWLEAHPEDINWMFLSENPAAVHLLERNKGRIDISRLSRNTNEKAVKIIYENDIFTFFFASHVIENLMENPSALSRFTNFPIHFFLKKPGTLLTNLFGNPAIVLYDYVKMQHQFLSTFGKELVETLYHPKNADKWEGWQIY
jgi:hypothetical protein